MIRILRKFFILKLIWNHPLNQGRKIQSISKFLRFQVEGRLNQNRIVVKWINDLRFLASPGETGMTINLYCGLSEPNEMLFMLHYLDESDVFFDIGANAGSYSLLAAGISKCQVYSFEPVLQTRKRLLENLSLNGLPTNLVQECALGSRPGTILFTQTLDAVNHVARPSDELSTVWVEMQVLDSFLHVPKVSLIKIDVEGYEMEILKGASTFLEKPSLRALIVETNGESRHYGTSESDIEEFLKKYHFLPYNYDPQTRSLVSLGQANKVGNTIFLRELNFVSAKIYNGPTISVNKNQF